MGSGSGPGRLTPINRRVPPHLRAAASALNIKMTYTRNGAGEYVYTQSHTPAPGTQTPSGAFGGAYTPGGGSHLYGGLGLHGPGGNTPAYMPRTPYNERERTSRFHDDPSIPPLPMPIPPPVPIIAAPKVVPKRDIQKEREVRPAATPQFEKGKEEKVSLQFLFWLFLFTWGKVSNYAATFYPTSMTM